MISIKIFKQTYINTYKATGHALFADYGNDIVCSSVSTLSILASNLIEQWSKVQTDIQSGHLELHILEPNEHTEKVMHVIMQALKDLVKQYPKHITLDIKEE